MRVFFFHFKALLVYTFYVKCLQLAPKFERLMTEAHVCSALLLSEIVLYFIEDYFACCFEVHVWRESSKQWSLCPFSELPLWILLNQGYQNTCSSTFWMLGPN